VWNDGLASSSEDGEHSKVTLETRADPTQLADRIILYGKDYNNGTDIKTELFARNEDGTVFQLTNRGLLNVNEFRFKTADESVSSSGTLQDDNDLSIALLANVLYEVSFGLRMFSASSVPDIIWRLETPANNLNRIYIALPESGGVTGRSFGNTYSEALDGVNTKYAFGTGILRPTAGGNLILRWAQQTSHATATTVMAGSFLRATRVTI